MTSTVYKPTTYTETKVRSCSDKLRWVEKLTRWQYSTITPSAVYITKTETKTAPCSTSTKSWGGENGWGNNGWGDNKGKGKEGW